jgi:hypothetical protein
VDDSASTAEDTAVEIDVLANDSDPEHDDLTVTIRTEPDNGSASVRADGKVTYTPAADFNGKDSFTYEVADQGGATDENGLTDEATVTVTVTPVNDAPVAVNDSATADEDAPVNVDVLANDSDPDGDALTVTIGTPPFNGLASVQADGTVTYTPEADFNGQDSFVYEVDDGGLAAQATVTVTVTPVNDAPVAVDDSARTDEDAAVEIDVLANDSDPDGDALTVTMRSQPSNGRASVVSGHAVTYTPKRDFHGEDSFVYEVGDGEATAEATVTVTVIPVNDPPAFAGPRVLEIAENSPPNTPVGPPVTASDQDGDTLVYSLSGPDAAWFTIDASTAQIRVGESTVLDYESDKRSYAVAVAARDEADASDTMAVTIVVTNVDEAPIAVDDTATTLEETPVDIAVLANDSDPDGRELTLASIVLGPTFGAVVAGAEGVVTYTPESEFYGTDTFVYAATDGTMTTEATVTVTVGANRVVREILPRETQARIASILSAITGRLEAGCVRAVELPVRFRLETEHSQDRRERMLEMLPPEQLLDGASFAVPLQDEANEGAGLECLWGDSDYRRLTGDDGGVGWNGSILSTHLGVDARIGDSVLLGALLSWSGGSFDYTEEIEPSPFVGGIYESGMTSFHPYASWQSPGKGLHLWAAAGYGSGTLEFDDTEFDRQSSDIEMTTVAAGASQALLSGFKGIAGGSTTLKLKAEGSLGRVTVEESGTIRQDVSEATRVRVSLEGTYESQFDSGVALTPLLEVGVLQDGGAGDSGTGLEAGGGLRFSNPSIGLTAEIRGRRVVRSESNSEEWGFGGSIRLDPGGKGGWSLNLRPAYGDAESGIQTMWNRDRIEQDLLFGDDEVRLDAELGYELLALGGRGRITPYGGLTMADGGSERYGIGVRFEIGQSAMLGLEAELRKDPTGSAQHGLMLRAQIRF